MPAPPAAYGLSTSGGNQRNAAGATQPWPGTVDAIRDIEENIWSPRLGIKGKVDITVEVKLHKRDKQVCIARQIYFKSSVPNDS